MAKLNNIQKEMKSIGEGIYEDQMQSFKFILNWCKN
jgi:hypothetical protein